DARRKATFELGPARPQREMARAQDLEHRLLLGLAEHRPGKPKWTRSGRVVRGHEEVRASSALAGRRPVCIPSSRESTNASHDASITLSETPIAPHSCSPSGESSSTRGIASL